MSALPIHQSQSTIAPVDLPKLRAVSTRPSIDVPVLAHEPVRRPKLQVVPETPVAAPVEKTGLERALDAATIGFTVVAGSVFALGLQYWLTF